MNRGKLAIAAFVAVVMATPGPALAQESVLIYRYKFYSDSSYTTQIGEDEGYCAFFGVGYTHTGQNSEYVTADPIAYCVDHGYYWDYAPL